MMRRETVAVTETARRGLIRVALDCTILYCITVGIILLVYPLLLFRMFGLRDPWVLTHLLAPSSAFNHQFAFFDLWQLCLAINGSIRLITTNGDRNLGSS